MQIYAKKKTIFRWRCFWGGLAWLFACVASCSFVFDLGVKFKFGLAFALVLILFSGSDTPPRRWPSTVSRFLFLLRRRFLFLSSPSSLLYLCNHLAEILPRHFFWKWKITTLKIFQIFMTYRCFFHFCALLYRCDVATYDLLKKWKKTNWIIFHKMGSQSLFFFWGEPWSGCVACSP